MSFIFFILAVTFFALWLSSNSSKAKRDNAEYDKGYSAARHDIIQSLKDGLKKGPITKEVLDGYKSGATAAVSVATQPQQAQAVISSADTIAFPGERGEESEAEAQVPALQPVINTAPEVVKSQRTKAEQTNRNLNVLLYAASFLIIAAAAAFVATNMPASVRLTGIWAVIIAF